MAWSGLAAAQTMNPAAPASGPATPVRQPAMPSAPATATPENQAAANPATNRANVTTRNPIRLAAATPSNRRDCSALRGIDKSECERRDTVRDDLPAGVTTGAAERRQ